MEESFMSNLNQNLNAGGDSSENMWKSIYILGGISTIVVLSGSLLDIFIGSSTGGNLSALPQTAIERFAQFKNNQWLGLYNLDLLNIINQIILIPAYLALFIAQRKTNAYAALSLILFLIGTTVFVSNNTALPMLDLSNKYNTSTIESQRALLAAAGESMLARGAHGSAGVFLGFLLPNIAGVIMSIAMLKGRVFGKINSVLGIAGSILIMGYIVLVTFVPEVKNMATLFAMPGGLLLMAWMVLFTIKLLKLGLHNKSKIVE
jgi:hypothetical protein